MSARIRGNISMEGATFSNANFSAAQIGASLYIRNNARLRELILMGAKIGGNLEMDGSAFGRVTLRGAKATRNISMNKSAIDGKFDGGAIQVGEVLVSRIRMFTSDKQEAILKGSTVKGDLAMSGATFNGDLDASALQVGADLNMEGLRARVVKLNFAQISGSFDERDARFAEFEFVWRDDWGRFSTWRFSGPL